MSDLVKRAIDVTGSALGLVVLSPALGVIAVMVRRKHGRPVLFRQQRPGRDGRCFTLLKFRTMTDERDAEGDLLPNDDRLTPFGRKLRSTSLDELPGLVNVLRGDMSLVGPRPLLPAYMTRYSPEQARRHEVRPGMTGLAQVSGRNDLSWAERFRLDVWYVDNRTLWLDLRIVARTVSAAVKRQGVHGPDGRIIEPFLGTDQRPAVRSSDVG